MRHGCRRGRQTGITALQGSYFYQTVSGSLSAYLQTYTAGGANMAVQLQAANVQVIGSSNVTFSGCIVSSTSVARPSPS